MGFAIVQSHMDNVEGAPHPHNAPQTLLQPLPQLEAMQKLVSI